MQKKKQTIIVAVILVVLAAAVAVLAYLNAPKNDLETGTLSILLDGEPIVTLTMAEIADMDYIEVEKEIVSSGFEDTAGLFRGVTVQSILESVDPALTEYSMVVAQAQDAYVTAFTMDEITVDNSILVAYLMDGESLGTIDGGGSGPFRIITAGDEFGTRSVRYLASLEVR